MKITNIRIHKAGRNVSLLADCKIRPVGGDTIYFTFDKQYEEWLYPDASPFAAALFIPCMIRGEDLIIDGSISRKLYDGMHRIMDIMLAWNVGMHRITIKAEHIVEDRTDGMGMGVGGSGTKKVATFFSGGVDSFYTYLKHRSDKEDAITHFLLIDGNDIDLRNRALWLATRENVTAIAADAGIETIEVQTNAQALLEPMFSPDFTHGGNLAAAGLCLRGGLKTLYIPSSFSYGENVHYGSHADIDERWSAEAIHFRSDGGEASRMEKIARQVGRSAIALEHLRVCYMNVKGTYNCGECEKCIRTMLELYALGKLNEAKTFPHVIPLDCVTSAMNINGFLGIGYGEILHHLEERNIDPELQAVIRKGLENLATRKKTANTERLIKKIIAWDHMYLRGKVFKIWLNIVHPY